MHLFTYAESTLSTCLRFEVEEEQVGWVQPKIASLLSRFPEVFISHGGAISVNRCLDSYAKRSEAVDQVLQELRKDESLTCLKGWRNEVRTAKCCSMDQANRKLMRNAPLSSYTKF